MGAIFESLPRHSTQSPVEAQRLLAGEVFVKVGVLGKETDRLAALHILAVTPKNAGLPRGRCQETQHHLHRRGFP